MNIGTKSVSVGPISLNNIKYSKVSSNTKTTDSNGYEEIDYNVPSSSINVDEEVKELENIRDILLERKEKLMPRYEGWQSHWEFISSMNAGNQRLDQFEMMQQHIDSTWQQLSEPNNYTQDSFHEKLAEGKEQFEHQEEFKKINASMEEQMRSELGEENWKRKQKIDADPHGLFYQQLWDKYLNAQDDSLINKAKEIDPDCSPEDYYFVWASAMCDENVFDILAESNDPRDIQLYNSLVDISQQKKDLSDEKEYLDNEIGTLDANIRQLNTLIKEYPYLQIMKSDDFKKYAENYQYADEDKLVMEYNEEHLRDYRKFSGTMMGHYANFDDDFPYLSDQEKILYRYLLETEGQDSVDKYMEAYQDKINQIHGYQLANEFINSLDLDSEGKVKESLANSLGVSVEGLDAGLNNFVAGIENAIINNEELMADDYKNMIVLQYLSEHSDYEFMYNFSQSFGNMLPSMVASMAVSAVATPAAGAAVGSSLMGISTFGNAKHQALVQGHDLVSSAMYGLFVGASEATLSYFLGRIPGISRVSGFTLKNLLMEGTEEFSQEWIDAGLRAVILEENVDLSTIPEQSMEAFLMGVMMSGFTNGGQAVTNIVINGTKYNINVEDTLELINEHPSMSIQEAMEEVNPEIFDNVKKNSASLPGVASVNDLNIIAVDNEVANANGDYIEALTNIIFKTSMQINCQQRRDVSNYLFDYLKYKGFSKNDAINILIYAGDNAIKRRGFSSNSVNLNGHIIEVREQRNMDYSSVKYTPKVVLNQIAKLPLEMQRMVKQINIHDTYNPCDIYWEQEYKMKDFHSAATGGVGIINVYPTQSINAATIPHEIAHSYDTAYAAHFGLGDRISKSDMWKNAMNADRAINGLNGVTKYARDSHSEVEDFAEAVALFYTNPKALNKFPNRKTLLTRILPQKQTGGVQQNTGAFQQNNYYGTNKTIAFGVDRTFDLALNAMIRKYGKKQSIINIQTYLDTGRLDVITGENGIREALRQFDIEDVRAYIRAINGGSLDISKLINERMR